MNENNTTDAIKKLASSTEIFDQVEKIGAIFNLHIDQVGELDAEIRDVLRGYSKASDFVQHVMTRLEIDSTLASKITEAVNKEIFQVIKDKMQSATPSQAATDLSTLEQIGKFTIEPQPTEQATDVTEADRPKILNDVENPKPTAPTKSETDILVDHLLGTSVVSIPPKPEMTVSSVIPKTESTAPIPKPPTNDSYREAVK